MSFFASSIIKGQGAQLYTEQNTTIKPKTRKL